MAPEDHEGATSLLQSFERRFLAARALPSFPWQVGGGRAAGIRVEHHGRRGREARAAFAHRWTGGGRRGLPPQGLQGHEPGWIILATFKPVIGHLGDCKTTLKN